MNLDNGVNLMLVLFILASCGPVNSLGNESGSPFDTGNSNFNGNSQNNHDGGINFSFCSGGIVIGGNCPAYPLPAGYALPTPPPAENIGFQVTGATATKQKDYSYIFHLTGTGFGSLGDYQILRLTSGGATLNLISDGQAQINRIELKELNISPTNIVIKWVHPFGPTSNDLVNLKYIKKDNSFGQSAPVRLVAN